MEISLYSVEECERIAKAASLRYVKDSMPGITRKKVGKKFIYHYPDGKQVVDPEELARIKSLAIPPAYSQVWICPYANGHIQATGRDTKNRKQYRYHALWQQERQQKKFHALVDFGKALPMIREHINQELDKTIKLTKTQVICAIIYLLDGFFIRIGNAIYAKQNKSYGLTTLRKKHLTLEYDKAILEFMGKSAKPWHIVLKEKKIIKVLKKCEAIPGYELFKYFDENNQLNVISSQDINAYLQTLTGQCFTAKDFRTWAACRETLKRLLYLDATEQALLKDVIKEVAELLGHTPTICQKSYIYAEIIDWWKDNRFSTWAKRRGKKLSTIGEDELLLYWLEQHKTCLFED
ncbi:Eukaryotic DNA topoisomerase I, catalytic core [Legionella beliardensis]|uniref:DNA topoisomerase n=1 Tax=Legionella beliardensis TaxID=91822 RepID=A0A378I169_9GAMM|nr:DNA topoisomerase IB [Legionella beliardensis]STX28346.1 Eukaryotic DNA topoisomerase I, catalytic core [Legionella beliardensis]